MENEAVIAGLKRKRAEIDGELRLAERRAAQLAADMGTIDATLRLFDPSVVPAAIKPKLRRPRMARVASGSFTRTVMDVLREASQPLTAREIAADAASRLALDVGTPRAMQRTIGQVRNVLARARNGVESVKDGDVTRWRVG